MSQTRKRVKAEENWILNSLGTDMLVVVVVKKLC
jgi:hypothetical protein